MSRGLKKAVQATPDKTKSNLARLLDVERATISAWYQVPKGWVDKVEKATGVPRHILRPDLYSDTT